MSERNCWRAGAILAGLAVALGAFGAHALRSRLTGPAAGPLTAEGARTLEIWEVAVRYQMYHALALLALALAQRQWRTQRQTQTRGWGRAAWCLLAGVTIFSGSLYALVLSGQKWLGAVTPLGGLLLIAGWLVAAASWPAAGDSPPPSSDAGGPRD